MKFLNVVFSTILFLAMTAGVFAADPVKVNNTVCPVSGMPIAADSDMEPVTVEHNGKVYNLCCQGCIDVFKSDPEKFRQIAESEETKGHEQHQH